MAKQTIQIADKPTLDEIKKKISDNYNLLNNSTYGLSALKGYLGNSTYGLNAIKNVLSDSTYGLSAIKSYLSNSTYGLSAIKSSLTSSGVKVVKSIQRGEAIEFKGTYTPYKATITLNTINPSKSIVLLYGGYPTTDNLPVRFDSLTSNTLILICYSGRPLPVMWQVVEFY